MIRRHAGTAWDNLTRYEIYMAADELLKIIRRNEGLEWAKFSVRDPLIRLDCSHFRTVNHPHRQSTSLVIVSNSILLT